MKIIPILSILLLSFSLNIYAQPGMIGVYGNQDGTICDLSDISGIITNVYVVHVNSPGATSARFTLLWEGDVQLTYMGERVTEPYFGIGTAFSGITINFGSCVMSPNMLMTLQFMGTGQTEPCSYLVVAPHTATGLLQVGDCSVPTPNLLVADYDCAPINNDGRCYCDLLNNSYGCPIIVPNAVSTWGSIKQLYR